jgi:5-deoxy-glucuronate isomerase
VRDHDVVLVPHGYHGPCIAAPGYPMYYLNVMAGPAATARWPSATTRPTAGSRDTGHDLPRTRAAR